jgi:hypothetical protein
MLTLPPSTLLSVHVTLAPGALTYTAVQTVNIGAHQAAMLRNARPTSAPVG